MIQRTFLVLVVCFAVLSAGLALFLWAPPLRGLRAFIQANLRETTIDGRVANAIDDRGIPDCDVRIESVGYDVLHVWEFGKLVKDSTTTDPDGSFRVSLRVLGRPQLTVSHPGYTTVHAYLSKPSGNVIRLVPLTAAREEVVGRLLSLEYRTGKEGFGIQLDKPKLVPMAEADVSIEIRDSGIRIEGHKDTRLLFARGDLATTGAYDVYANGCTAPESGYVDATSLPFDSPPGIVFVQGPGPRYGSIAVNARWFQSTDSTHLHIATVPVRLNRAGGRGLCTERFQGVFDW